MERREKDPQIFQDHQLLVINFIHKFLSNIYIQLKIALINFHNNNNYTPSDTI